MLGTAEKLEDMVRPDPLAHATKSEEEYRDYVQTRGVYDEIGPCCSNAREGAISGERPL
jgi:hypothetical protein